VDEDEDEYYEEEGYNMLDLFEHTQEEINKNMVVPLYGEEAWNTLREKGVYYPNMDQYFKKLDNNEYQTYPENKRFYSMLELEEYFDEEAYTHDICVNPIDVANLQRCFDTPSKKIECHLASMTSRGIDAMPTWRDEHYVKVPEGKFKFITGRHAQFTQNSTQNNIMLLELMPENYVWINEDEAKELGIKHGDEVELKSSVGAIKIKAYPTAKIIPQTLFFVHGFGAKSTGLTFAHRNGASDNEIIEDNIEPTFGCANMHNTLVTIRKV
jgi:thiosulfate reductase/polysulfide reductase chain A